MSSIGVSGFWKAILPGTAVGASGSWKAIEGMWIGAGGEWKQFFQSLQTSLAGSQASHTQIANVPSSSCTAGISLNSNGTEYAFSAAGSATGHDLGAWLESGTAGEFWARATVTSGTLTGGTANLWLQLSTTRSWNITDSNPAGDAVTAGVTIEIATDSSGNNIIDSANYSLSADLV